MFKQYTILSFILLIFVIGCEKNTTISQVKNVSDNEPDQEFLNSKIVITEHGITSAIVQAESVNVYTESDFTSVKGGILIDFFNDDGENTSTLTAQSGEVWGLYAEVDSLKAKGNVEIVSADKTKKMETSSSFNWIPATHKIYADGLVKLITEDAVEQGINFVANDDLSEYTMDNVSGVFESGNIILPGR